MANPSGLRIDELPYRLQRRSSDAIESREGLNQEIRYYVSRLELGSRHVCVQVSHMMTYTESALGLPSHECRLSESKTLRKSLDTKCSGATAEEARTTFLDTARAETLAPPRKSSTSTIDFPELFDLLLRTSLHNFHNYRPSKRQGACDSRRGMLARACGNAGHSPLMRTPWPRNSIP